MIRGVNSVDFKALGRAGPGLHKILNPQLRTCMGSRDLSIQHGRTGGWLYQQYAPVIPKPGVGGKERRTYYRLRKICTDRMYSNGWCSGRCGMRMDGDVWMRSVLWPRLISSIPVATISNILFSLLVVRSEKISWYLPGIPRFFFHVQSSPFINAVPDVINGRSRSWSSPSRSSEPTDTSLGARLLAFLSARAAQLDCWTWRCCGNNGVV